MGAVCPFPEPLDLCEQPLVFAYSEYGWSPSESQESLDEAIAKIGLTEFGEPPFYRDPGMVSCLDSLGSGNYLDAPRAWQLSSHDWHPRNNLPYDLKIPSKASASGGWPVFEQEASCSGVGSLSPHTTDSRSEVGGSYTQHPSPYDRSSVHIPFGGLSQCHAHGSYHPPATAAVISPQELQHHHDDYLDVSSPKTDLQGIGAGQTYYQEDVTVYSHAVDPDRYCHKDEGIGSSPPPLIDESMAASINDEDDMEEDAGHDDDGDWSPKAEKQGHLRRLSRRSTANKNLPNGTAKRSQRAKFATSQAPRPTRIAKKAQRHSVTQHQTNRNGSNPLPCSHCAQRFPSDSTLKKHVLASHTRPFICTFHNYGCDSTVGSKNEWKRHINVQHMHLETWRCDIGACAAPGSCAPGDVQHNGRRISSSHTASIAGPLDNAASQPHDFDRKDLFTQHMKRMHAPGASASRAEKANFEASIEEAQKRCYLKLREPPVNTICPFCPDHPAFESWDDRIEHVGKHLEKNDVDREAEVEDGVLIDWLRREGYVQLKGSGWKLIEMGKKKKRSVQREEAEEEEEEGDEDAEGEYE